MSANSADEQLIVLVNKGYQVLAQIKADYATKKASGGYVEAHDNPRYEAMANQWGNEVVAALNSIFPTELEANTFLNPHIPFGAVSGDYAYQSFVSRIPYFIRGLDTVRQNSIPRYTDLPIKTRLFVEDIDSFRKVRDVNPAAVAELLSQSGMFDRAEDAVQIILEQILDVPLHKNDWGGEVNDLYTANVILQGARIETAFLLKGHGFRGPTMEIGDCGANGDQLVRLVRSPARLFVVQYVGNISEAVIEDIAGKVRDLRGKRLLLHHRWSRYRSPISSIWESVVASGIESKFLRPFALSLGSIASHRVSNHGAASPFDRFFAPRHDKAGVSLRLPDIPENW